MTAPAPETLKKSREHSLNLFDLKMILMLNITIFFPIFTSKAIRYYFQHS